MAKTQTVEEHAELRDRLDPPGSMPPAPEGSADRVRDDDLLPFDADEGDSVVSPEAKDGSILVNDYDANGEAIARQVPIEPAQPEFPDMPEKHPGLWPDYQARRIAEVHISFSGDIDLSREAAAHTADFERFVTATVTGQVTGHKYTRRKKGGGLIGAATMVVEGVRFGEGDVEGSIASVSADVMAAIDRIIDARPPESVLDECLLIAALMGDSSARDEIAQRQGEFGDDLPDDDEPSALEASLDEALAE